VKGLYTLVMRLKRSTRCRVGALGNNCLKEGMYVYTGSARGEASTSLERRIERHWGKRRRRFWHIDYLLGLDSCSIITCVYSESDRDLECAVNRTIRNPIGGVFPVRGFGSSDCNCRSHLMYVQSGNTARTLHALMAVYRKLGLRPRLWNARSASTDPIV
jgi:Uri superfamily endonuclease